MKGNGLATIKTTRSTQIVLLIGVSVSCAYKTCTWWHRCVSITGKQMEDTNLVSILNGNFVKFLIVIY